MKQRFLGIVFACLAVFVTTAALAQDAAIAQYPIVTVDRVRLVRESDFGKRLFSELNQKMRDLQVENNKIESDLSAEELALRDKRKTMDPSDFRVLAGEFDVKVNRIRQQRKELEDEILQENNSSQVKLIQTAAPFMFEIMTQHGAVAVLERSTVVLDLASIDITDQVITRMNADLGDGVNLPKSE